VPDSPRERLQSPGRFSLWSHRPDADHAGDGASICGVSREKLLIQETNLKAGIAYLKQQYDRFPEITDQQERLKFALASYNGGRGYINRALALARKEDAPWQTWDGVKTYLAAADCTVGGKHPDHRQIITYVDRIWADYQYGVNER